MKLKIFIFFKISLLKLKIIFKSNKSCNFLFFFFPTHAIASSPVCKCTAFSIQVCLTMVWGKNFHWMPWQQHTHTHTWKIKTHFPAQFPISSNHSFNFRVESHGHARVIRATFSNFTRCFVVVYTKKFLRSLFILRKCALQQITISF